MRQYTPNTEVDFVVIGSGAAGGIMAKQLSQAGFSVVVLEQGGWGKYGRDHEYNKDEWLNRNLAQADLTSAVLKDLEGMDAIEGLEEAQNLRRAFRD